MKTKRFISMTARIFAISLLAGVAGCGVAEVNPPEAADQHEISLDIMMARPQDEPTRAPSSTGESEVENVAVLLFRDEAGTQRLYHCADAGELTSTASGYSFRVKVDLGKAGLPATLKGVLLCNVKASRLIPHVGKTYAEISALLTDAFTAADCGSMTMWGDCSPLIQTSLASQQISASVVRDRARVDIDASEVEESLFRLSEVYIYRHPDKVAPLPVSGAAITIPSTASKTAGSSFSVTPSGNKVERSVYIPESDLIMGGDGDPADSHRLERTAIVVGGYYKGSAKASYYRIDFTGTDGRLRDIVRNHRYVAHITDVRGPGAETPDEAYSTVSVGLTATIIDWIDADTYVVFDGAHWLSVDSRSVTVGPDSGNVSIMRVASDVEGSEWKIGWNDDPAEIPADMRNAMTLTGSLFGVRLPAGDLTDGGDMVFTALQDLPKNMESRGEVLHLLLSGRLHVAIDVRQRDIAASPWEDGGAIEGSDIFE